MIKLEESYLEWCDIMQQAPNDRDQIIFIAGHTFSTIESRPPNKRDPGSDGVLPLSDEELLEFCKLFLDDKGVVKSVNFNNECVIVIFSEPYSYEFGELYVDEVKIILWLAERFNLVDS